MANPYKPFLISLITGMILGFAWSSILPIRTHHITPTLRTAILDALMERWQEDATYPARLQEPMQRAYLSSCLDTILPVAEPMIREAALKEAANVARAVAVAASGPAHQGDFYASGQVDAADAINSAILALGEPK